MTVTLATNVKLLNDYKGIPAKTNGLVQDIKIRDSYTQYFVRFTMKDGQADYRWIDSTEVKVLKIA